MSPVLLIENVSVAFGAARVVSDVSLQVVPGAFHAIVGESGSGKTMLARACLGLLPAGGRVTAGRILLKGDDVTAMLPEDLRRIRGRGMGMIFQDPMISLNPAMRVGAQMVEGLRLDGVAPAEGRDRARALLDRVGIPCPAEALERFPHEFSGGMRQRIMIASVLLRRPALVIADEPTTALDVIVQAEVLDLLAEAAAEEGAAVLLVTHDLGVVADRADTVTVMHHGEVVDGGETARVMLRPSHPQTRALLEALPERRPLARTPASSVLLTVRDLHVAFPGRRRWPWSHPAPVEAVRGVDLDIAPGETLGLVGGSGSGKTTLGRAVLGLVATSAGTVVWDGEDITHAAPASRRALAREMQIVFQDPMSSLDPRMRLDAIVAEGLRHRPHMAREEARARARTALEECGLGTEFARRFPHQLSDGQRQRVAIARALVLDPRLLVLDEPVSALDVTVQARILRLLADIARRRSLAMLFVTHDLGVVEQVADRVAVMHEGRIVETGPTSEIFDAPRHEYTKALLSMVPELERDGAGYRIRRRGRKEGSWDQQTRPA